MVREEQTISAETPNMVALVECQMIVTMYLFLYCVYTCLILIVFNCVVEIDLLNCACIRGC